LNSILEWIRKNPRNTAIILISMILFSAAVGAVLGILNRKKEYVNTETGYSELFGIEKKELDKKFPSIAIPSPVVPSLPEEEMDFLFYLDENPIMVESKDLVRGNISEILKYREVGVKCDIKPFQFKNQEMEVLTRIEELVEPE